VSFLVQDSGYIIPTVFVLTLIGSYSVRNSYLDLAITTICGILGFFMSRFDIKMAPVILGIILGPMAEQGYRHSISIGEAHGPLGAYFLGRPICIILIIVTLVMIVFPLYREHRLRRQQGKLENQVGS
jgi:putative tricarboxylic transport membrane protein